VLQSFDWVHGIATCGAALETETTFAIIGEEGVPEINLMSIQDFVSIPLGRYVGNNLEFGKKVKHPPVVFGVNYFPRDKQGEFVNDVRDKHVWVKWMELRVHGDVGATRSPLGWIPKHEDLVPLFRHLLDKSYRLEEYVKQFTVRVRENLAKLARAEKFHRENVAEPPPELSEVFAAQRLRLEKAREELGDYVSPLDLLAE
jgi:phosphoenolpyruvate carboxykinase (GTP)